MSEQDLNKRIKDEYYVKLKALQKIFNVPNLRGKIFVAGGLVTGILSQQPSTRLHDDIDIVMSKDERPNVKDALILAGAKITYDSLLVNDNVKEDSGFEMIMDGIKIVFYPFVITPERIVQIDAPNIREGKLDLNAITFKLPPNVELTTSATMHMVDPNNPANTEDRIIGIIEPAVEILIKQGKLGNQNIAEEQRQKNIKDFSQLANYVDMAKVEALIQANIPGSAIVNAGEQATQEGTAYTKGRRASKATAAYADALALAFITGIVGGLFLFLFLKAIQ